MHWWQIVHFFLSFGFAFELVRRMRKAGSEVTGGDELFLVLNVILGFFNSIFALIGIGDKIGGAWWQGMFGLLAYAAVALVYPVGVYGLRGIRTMRETKKKAREKEAERRDPLGVLVYAKARITLAMQLLAEKGPEFDADFKRILATLEFLASYINTLKSLTDSVPSEPVRSADIGAIIVENQRAMERKQETTEDLIRDICDAMNALPDAAGRYLDDGSTKSVEELLAAVAEKMRRVLPPQALAKFGWGPEDIISREFDRDEAEQRKKIEQLRLLKTVKR